MKTRCRLKQKIFVKIHERGRTDVRQLVRGAFLKNAFLFSFSMVKYSLNTKNAEVRNMLIAEYNELGIQNFEEKWEISGRVVREWKRLRSATGTTEPRYSHLGRPHSLSPREMERMEKYLIKNPYSTNADLATFMKNKIRPREAGRLIDQSPRGFVWKLEQEDVEATFSKRHYEEGLKFINTNKHVPLNCRVYVDETRISSRVRRRRGRFPRGVQPWSPKNVKYPGNVVICAIKDYQWLHPGKVFPKGGLTTEEFEDYVENDLSPLLEDDDVVYWDQWGRSGRAKNPVAHHFSPRARELVEATGAKLRLLPPSGKFLDPIELVFGDTKRIYDKKLGAKTTRMHPSKVTYAMKQKLWRAAELQVSRKSFIRAYKERANGQEFKRVARERGLI